MLVYGHRAVRLSTRAALRELTSRVECLSSAPDHDGIVDLLVDWGAIESAVADALSPECDEELAALDAWRAASDAVAGAVCASWAEDRVEARQSLRRAGATLVALLSGPMPDDVMVRTAEGFAHYALFPEQYIAAAEHFVRTHHPHDVLCIGLRSIGSILAHVVAAALRRHAVRVGTRSVRPRGDPFDRRLRVSPRLTGALRSHGASHVVIVDEGPGVSGSSFAAAADFFSGLKFTPSQIVLFPSWAAPERALRAERGRRAWRRHVRITVDFDALWLQSGRLFGGSDNLQDLSAGRWRSLVITDPSAWPAVHPQHERRKYLAHRGDTSTIHRFAGLGKRGHAIARRARRLADAGFCAQAGPLSHGFLEQTWIQGVPLTSPSAAHVERIAAYTAHVGRSFRIGEAEQIDEVLEMAIANADRALEMDAAAPLERLARSARRIPAERVAVDGRMLPHEWIATPTRLFKVDALDHHDDDFWPGCRDIAWDVAGAIVEFGWSGAERAAFLTEYERASGDRAIAARLPFYEAAYLAYRIGYTSLAADTLAGSDEGVRFTLLSAGYRRCLAALPNAR
jgi:hypothetical protein